MSSERYTLWQPDESRAELALEKTVSGIKITVFSCSDTVNIQLHKTGRLEIGLSDDRTDQSAALGCDRQQRFRNVVKDIE